LAFETRLKEDDVFESVFIRTWRFYIYFVVTQKTDLLLYVFFWVILRRLNFILFTYLPMKMEQSVPKRRHIKFRRWGITHKKTYNIQNTAKVWNQEGWYVVTLFLRYMVCP